MDHERFEKVDYLVIGGAHHRVNGRVVLWGESGLEFKSGDGARRRHPKAVVDLFCLHWTGSENDIGQLYRTLDSRELGVEFAIDVDGVIWQFCDPVLVDTFDAGPVNKRSFGVEVVNYGFTGSGLDEPPKRGLARGTDACELNGKRRSFARFYPKQLGAISALLDAVTSAVPTIPRKLPVDSNGAIKARTLSSAELSAFKGVLGHFHISDSKSDPGLAVFDYLMQNGYR